MRRLAAVLFFSSIFAATASAQYGGIWFNAGQSIMSDGKIGDLPVATPTGAQTQRVEFGDGFRFGFRMGINGEGITGWEFMYAYSRSQLRFIQPNGDTSESGMGIHTGGLNYLIHFTPQGTRIRPFVTGGGIFANYVPPGQSVTSGGGQTKFGFNYGGGVKLRLTDIYAIRFDLRQFTTPRPNFGAPFTNQDGWIKLTEASAGFGIVF